MAKQLTYDELLAQNNFLKKHAEWAEKKALDYEEKYKEKTAENKELSAEIKQLKIDYSYAMEQLKLSKKKLFGASSEKNTPVDGQINFFNEAETERTPFLPEPKIEEIIVPSHKRKKKRTFEEKYGNLPVKTIETDLSDEEKMCEKCGSEMTFLKWETRHEIEVIPAQVSVNEYKKAVYVCKSCDKNVIESNFKTSETVSALIEKSPVSPSLLSWIMNQKFCLALPLYRQEQELKRMGVMLSRQTMANWMIAGANLLKPLYEKMHEVLLNESILHADETPLEVLNTPDNDKPLNAYMWVYRTWNNADTSVVLYDYENGRSGLSYD